MNKTFSGPHPSLPAFSSPPPFLPGMHYLWPPDFAVSRLHSPLHPQVRQSDTYLPFRALFGARLKPSAQRLRILKARKALQNHLVEPQRRKEPPSHALPAEGSRFPSLALRKHVLPLWALYVPGDTNSCRENAGQLCFRASPSAMQHGVARTGVPSKDLASLPRLLRTTSC